MKNVYMLVRDHLDLGCLGTDVKVFSSQENLDKEFDRLVQMYKEMYGCEKEEVKVVDDWKGWHIENCDKYTLTNGWFLMHKVVEMKKMVCKLDDCQWVSWRMFSSMVF